MNYDKFILKTVKKTSPTVARILKAEMDRQNRNVELIASENFPCDAIKAVTGSIFMNKYTEGMPGKRYYGGCENFDALEEYGEEKFQEAFKTDYHFNLQPSSGSNANMIAYSAVMEVGDTLLSMDMGSGSHLSHSSPVSFVSKIYNVETYSINSSGCLDYNEILKIAKKVKPKAIMCGASAYPRKINFKKFREIAHEVGAYLIADIAHISGLVIADKHYTPFGYADIVTMTTQKTFRANRGGVIACRPELKKQVDSAVFPRNQGGALQNEVAGKVIGAEIACTKEYKKYITRVVNNTAWMCTEFKKLGYKIVSGGTDNHLFLIDFSETHPDLSGKMVQDELDKYYITVNKNGVPNDKRSPMQTSGIRIGCAAMTTKGWKAKDFIKCAHEIDAIIKSMSNKGE